MHPVANHLIARHPDVRTALSAHAGKRFRIRISGLVLTALIDTSGYLKTADTADTVLTFHPSAIRKILDGRTPGVGDLDISGDHAFGMTLLPLLARLHYRAEDDIGRLFGQRAAEWAAQTRTDIINDCTDLRDHFRRTVSRRVRNAEHPVALHREPLQEHSGELARLRDDTARLEARIRLLEQNGR